MKKILHISSSVNLQSSTSREIGQLLVQQLKTAHPATSVVRRDLAKDASPHIGSEFLHSLPNPAADALALSRELVAELLGTDLLVIESPMYNFTIPSPLKAWIDHIVRYDLTVKISDNGRQGLLSGTKAILVLSSGGVYSEGPAGQMDHQEPYLRTILAFVGITDVTTIRIEGTAWGEEHRQSSLDQARAQVCAIVGAL